MADEEAHRDITYHDALEALIAKEAEKCAGLAWLHTKAEALFSTQNTIVALPTIVLSTLVGFLSGTSPSIFAEATTASIGIGSVSLFTGVLSTIGTFFAFAKKQEGHRIAAIQYAKLGRFLAIELALPREERIAAGDLLKMTKENIERLLEIAPPRRSEGRLMHSVSSSPLPKLAASACCSSMAARRAPPPAPPS